MKNCGYEWDRTNVFDKLHGRVYDVTIKSYDRVVTCVHNR